MNLKLEDLSQYIVLIIFVLIIIKVLGDGFIGSIYELLTGKKKEDEFDIDSMISRKKSQLNLTPQSTTTPSERNNLKEKVKQLENSNQKELLDLLQSLEWGDIKRDYATSSLELIKDISSTKGLGKIATHFFSNSLLKKPESLLDSWKTIYDNSILWTNLVNKADSLPKQKALVSFNDSNISKVSNLSPQILRSELESLLDPTTLDSINFVAKPFSQTTPSEIFEQYTEKVNLFKSLCPIVPISKESSNKWAKEVLGLVGDDHSHEVIKKHYKEVTSKIHPDKYTSLNLNDDQVSILNSNLALVNKAYTLLKK
ncbi:hypothetical protein [Halobacteriovorax sp.]|uniref:hypothetical protein n=1 Tax=Halobacteriovorax sp. TaxID=2020862 RepID=UPI00356776E6